MYKGYLIDLDGTAYLGDKVIIETVEFINRLNRKKIPYLFLTNNASKNQQDVANKLIEMGYSITKESIYTSAMATSKYLKTNNKKIYCIGSEDLKNELMKDNELTDLISEAEIVVVGYNNKISYKEMSNACKIVEDGGMLISTNPDLKIPMDGYFLPGNGSITQLIEKTTNKKAIYIGKPNKLILEYALEQLKISKNEVSLIGDNYDTDIMCGINAKVDTIYVQTGVTSLEEIETKKNKPTHVVKNLSEWKI